LPSNHVLINNSMEYIVNDNRMDEFLNWLNENGYAVDTGIKKEADETIPEITSSYSQIEA
jgi:hypothetical protein